MQFPHCGQRVITVAGDPRKNNQPKCKILPQLPQQKTGTLEKRSFTIPSSNFILFQLLGSRKILSGTFFFLKKT